MMHTVQDIAAREGVTCQTVYKWLRDDKMRAEWDEHAQRYWITEDEYLYFKRKKRGTIGL